MFQYFKKLIISQMLGTQTWLFVYYNNKIRFFFFSSPLDGAKFSLSGEEGRHSEGDIQWGETW